MAGTTVDGGLQPISPAKKYAFSSKTNAQKEIKSWGRDYESLADGTMRSAGQLTGNVTEARMLQTKIMDMSKERYKYITQADFDMKFFLSGQQRKTKVMPALLQDVDVAYWLSKKTARHVPKFSSASASNARFAYLDRMENSGEKCKEFADDNPFAMPEPPQRPSPEKQLPEFYRIRLKELEEAELAKATFQTQPVLRPSTTRQVKFCAKNKKDEVKLPIVKSAKSLPTRGDRETPTAERSSRDKAKQDSSKRRTKSVPPNTSRSVEDPRYKYLEGSLSDKYMPHQRQADSQKTQSIIDSLDSLHVPSRHSTTNSRPKLQKTILEYLRARGFDV